MWLLHLAERFLVMFLGLFGVKSDYFQTSVGRMHYLSAAGTGTLPPIVLLHGISSNAAHFGELILHIKKHTSRVIALDAPCHGFSEIIENPNPERLLQGVTDFFDHHISAPVIVVGNSMGGGLALNLALERPDKVGRLVLLSPGGAPMTNEEIQVFWENFDMEKPGRAAMFLRNVYHTAPFYLPIAAYFVKLIFRQRWLKNLKASFRADHLLTAERLQSLKPPSLLIWGKADRLMPDLMVNFFRNHRPAHMTMTEPDEFGHCPQFDNCRTLTQQIVTWAQSGA